MARSQWFMIGIGLGVDPSTLDAIRCESNNQINECFSKMLHSWLQQGNPQPTWSQMISVLRSPIVGYMQLAEQLSSKLNMSSGVTITQGNFFNSRYGLQWNPSKTDITRTHDFVHYTGCPSLRGYTSHTHSNFSVLVIRLWPKNALRIHGPGVTSFMAPRLPKICIYSYFCKGCRKLSSSLIHNG